MLDYNLVTSKATYRMVTDKDIPTLRRLVRGFYAETTNGAHSAGAMEATVRELERHRDKGTVFIFERGEKTVGYAIVINCWSNEFGGNMLFLDEVYVLPAERGQGIAGDFMDLLAKVAPRDTVAMQLEVDPSRKKLAKFYEKKGFIPTKNRVMVRSISGRRD
jgi:GNAT superfamily N-acetyltransferase